MATSGGFDAGTYGRSFADVYDDWYPDPAGTASAVDRVAGLAGSGGTVLELGVGTGRLALPLAAAGCRVLGIDSSTEMLDRLRAKDPAGTVTATAGDVADASAWPAGPVDLVLAANNLLLNLPDAGSQQRCVELAARHLRPGGVLVVEAVVPAALDRRQRHLEVREVTPASVVLIATDADPGTGVVQGQHVELRDGEPVRLRPWRVRPVDVAELDGWASAAGLGAPERTGGWDGSPFDPDGGWHVTCYRA